MKLFFLLVILQLGTICFASQGGNSVSSANHTTDVPGFVDSSSAQACRPRVKSVQTQLYSRVEEEQVSLAGEENQPVHLRDCKKCTNGFTRRQFAKDVPFRDFTSEPVDDISSLSSIAKDPSCCLNICRDRCCRPGCEYVCSNSSFWHMIRTFCCMTCCTDTELAEDPLKQNFTLDKYALYCHFQEQAVRKSTEQVALWDEGNRHPEDTSPHSDVFW